MSGTLPAGLVLPWLSENPVPPFPSAYWDEWAAVVAGLDATAFPELIEGLRSGDDALQYACTVALREVGAVVGLVDDGTQVRYRVEIPPEAPFDVHPTRHEGPLITTVEGAMVTPEITTLRREPDPYERITAAADAIERRREEMKALSQIRAGAVRELLDRGVTRSEVARRLDVHPNYVSHLAKAGGPASGQGAERELLGVSEVAELLGRPPSAIQSALRQRSLLGWKTSSGWRLPRRQLDEGGSLAPGLEPVLEVLADRLDDRAAVEWMTSPQEDLAGKTHLDLLWERRGEEVLQRARGVGAPKSKGKSGDSVSASEDAGVLHGG